MLEAIIGGFIGMSFAIGAAITLMATVLRLCEIRKQIEKLFLLQKESDEQIKQLAANAIAYQAPDIAKIIH